MSFAERRKANNHKKGKDFRQKAYTTTRRERSGTVHVKDHHFSYFYDLPDNPGQLSVFPDRWNELEQREFQGKSLALILSRSVSAVLDHPALAHAQTAARHMANRIGVWTGQASASMETFNANDLASSVVALGHLARMFEDRFSLDERFLMTWQVQATREIYQFNTRQMANIVLAFGRLHQRPTDHFQMVWMSRAQELDFSKEDKAQIEQAAWKLRLPDIKSVYRREMPSNEVKHEAHPR
ncbi:MAG: hypothetical protein SFW62_02990 [Alphaproteobacteria bacterium]|nr:hypothetical protein [Alphaproteobacteria bacterium]